MTPRGHKYSLNSSNNTRQGWNSLPPDARGKFEQDLGLETEIRSSQADLSYAKDATTDRDIRVKHELFMTTTKNTGS